MSCIVKNFRLSDRGYPITWHNGKHARAHRLAYAEANGVSLESIKGFVVRHKCDNRACVNPDHLELGKQADNVRDMLDRGRKVTVRGDRHKCSKLAESDIPKIRKRLAAGESQRSIGRSFGVSQKIIFMIAAGKAWSHIK